MRELMLCYCCRKPIAGEFYAAGDFLYCGEHWPIKDLSITTRRLEYVWRLPAVEKK